MSNRLSDFPTPEELAASFVPIPDDEIERPKPRIGPELLHRIEQDPKDGALVQIDELAAGCRYAMFYVGDTALPGLMVANLNDEWCKWRDGKKVGPLTFSAKAWRLLQVPADAEFAPLVAVAKPREASPHLSDFGALIEGRDAGVACQQLAELRGYLVNRVQDIVGELPAYMVRDEPVRVAFNIIEEHLAGIVRQHEVAAARAADDFALGDTPTYEREGGGWRTWMLLLAAAAAAALTTAGTHALGWW